MKKVIIGLLALGSLSLFAETFSCRVKGFSDYTVEVNTDGDAAFFDNNEWIILKYLGGGNGVEDIAGADFKYSYKGLDIDGESEIGLTFITYKSKNRNPNGEFTFIQGQESIDTKIFCKKVLPADLLSGI